MRYVIHLLDITRYKCNCVPARKLLHQFMIKYILFIGGNMSNFSKKNYVDF